MQYKVQNVTMVIDQTDGDVAGDCICYIPFTHKRFLRNACGMTKNADFTNDGCDVIFEGMGEVYIDKDLRHYYTTSADILISYLSWLFTEEGEQTISVEYSNPFWAIHDAQHALNDESGCTVYVDQYVELERLHEAFKLMITEGYQPSYELIEEVNQAYNERFGKNVDFAEYYLEDNFYDEEEEFAEDTI